MLAGLVWGFLTNVVSFVWEYSPNASWLYVWDFHSASYFYVENILLMLASFVCGFSII